MISPKNVTGMMVYIWAIVPKLPNFRAIFRLVNDDIAARINGTVGNRDTAGNHLCQMKVDGFCCVFDGFCHGFYQTW